MNINIDLVRRTDKKYMARIPGFSRMWIGAGETPDEARSELIRAVKTYGVRRWRVGKELIPDDFRVMVTRIGKIDKAGRITWV